jgi:hypothetical protein
MFSQCVTVSEKEATLVVGVLLLVLLVVALPTTTARASNICTSEVVCVLSLCCRRA